MPVVRYELEGDADDLVNEFGRAASAAKATSKATDQATKAVREWDQKAAGAAVSTGKMEKGLKGLERIATGFQGRIGGAAGVVAAFGEGLAQATSILGPYGAAAAGAALAVAGIGFVAGAAVAGLKSLSDAALAALDRLDDLDAAAGISARSRNAIEEYRDSTVDLEVAWDRLTVLLSGPAAAAMADIADTAVTAVSAVDALTAGGDRLFAAWDVGTTGLSVAMSLLPTALQNQASLVGSLTRGFLAYGDAASDASHDARAGLESVAVAFDSLDVEMQEALGTLVDFDAELKQAEQDAKEALRAAEKRQAEAAKAADKRVAQNLAGLKLRGQGIANLQAAEKEQADAAAKSFDEIVQQELRNLELIDQARDELAEADRAREEATKEAMEQLNQFVKERVVASIHEAIDLTNLMLDKSGQRAQDSISYIQDEIGALKDKRKALRQEMQTNEDMSDLDKMNNEGEIARIGYTILAHEEASKRAEKAAKKQATVQFALTQTAAAGQATMNAAVATLALLTSPGFALMGPGAIPAVGLAVGTLLGIQLAAIAAQDPPKVAHDGFAAPDEIDIRARRGESVVNQRGTEVAEMNRATSTGGMSRQPVVLVLEDAGRQIGEALLRELERPGDVRSRFLDLVGA